MALIRIDWNPDKRRIRQFGAGVILFGALLGALLSWRGHPQARAAWAAGLCLGLAALAAPAGAGRWIYKAWMGAAFVVGSLVSYGVLGAAYYGFLSPLGLLFRLLGRDPLRLKRPAGETYWLPARTPEEKTDYERLF